MTQDNLTQRFFKKTPLLFPLVAVFHIFIAFHALWSFRDLDFSFADWERPLLLSLYALAWLAVCTLKKWAAYVYIFLTSCSLLMHFILAPRIQMPAFDAVLFPADVIFCFCILFFFKRFE